MKKIFLTSALAICVACPAFADDPQTITGGDNTNECVQGVLGVDGSENNDTANIEAVWEPETYTVTYDKGAHGTYTGATAATATATYDQSFTPAATAADGGIVADTGYTFVGWNTATGQTSANYTGTGQGVWNSTSNLTLYAAYTANGYQVTYDCGSVTLNAGTQNETVKSATGSISDQDVTYGSPYTLNNGASCSLAGYTFGGWSCTNGLSGALNNNNPASGTWSLTSGSTCTAIWNANTITLVWDKNGADSADIADTSCTYDGSITLPTQPTKTGYTFGGWELKTNTTPAQ